MLKRIELIECNIDLLETIVNDRSNVANCTGVYIPDVWPLETEVYSYFLTQLRSEPSLCGWLGYIGIDRSRKTLVGDCGFLGSPDHFGKVEIGYSVVPEERGVGYAGEMVALLVNIGFRKGASSVMARTAENNIPSMRVLEKCGFSQYKQKFCPDEGNMIFWKKGKNE